MAVMRADKEYLDHVFGKGVTPAAGETDVSMLSYVLGKAKQSWADVYATHARKMGDQTKTEAARLVESGKFAKAAIESRRQELRDAKSSATGELERVQAKLQRATNPPSDPGEAAIFAEIRAHLRGMESGARLKLLDEAARNNDTRVLHAAVSGPDFLSVVPPERVEHYREQFLTRVAPNEYGHAYRLRVGMEEAERAVTLLEEHTRELVDLDTAAAFERSAA